MSDSITVALITGGFSVLAVFLSNIAAQSKLQTQLEKSLAVYQVKLEELTSKVEKHNTIIERTYKLEEEVALHEERIKVVNHRLEDIQKKGA